MNKNYYVLGFLALAMVSLQAMDDEHRAAPSGSPQLRASGAGEAAASSPRRGAGVGVGFAVRAGAGGPTRVHREGRAAATVGQWARGVCRWARNVVRVPASAYKVVPDSGRPRRQAFGQRGQLVSLPQESSPRSQELRVGSSVVLSPRGASGGARAALAGVRSAQRPFHDDGSGGSASVGGAGDVHTGYSDEDDPSGDEDVIAAMNESDDDDDDDDENDEDEEKDGSAPVRGAAASSESPQSQSSVTRWGRNEHFAHQEYLKNIVRAMKMKQSDDDSRAIQGSDEDYDAAYSSSGSSRLPASGAGGASDSAEFSPRRGASGGVRAALDVRARRGSVFPC